MAQYSIFSTNYKSSKGRVFFEKEDPNRTCFMRDRDRKSTRVAILHRDLFFSSFNQMFHLGRFDPRIFKLVYDGYPHVRIFKLMPASK